MKQITTIGLAFLLLVGNAAANPKLILDETFGLPEKIEVLLYDGETQTVQVFKDGHKSDRSLSSFSPEIQGKILEWAADNAFASGGIKIVFEKQEAEKKTNRGARTEVSYRIDLKNQSSFSFEDLRVTYRIFFESVDGEMGLGRVESASETLEILPKDVKSIETKTVTLRDEKRKSLTVSAVRSGTEFGYEFRPQQDRLLGIHIEIEKRGLGGEALVLTFSDGRVPKKTQWAQYKPVVSVSEHFRGQPNDADMVMVGGGSFPMGDHWEIGSDNEHPVHQVTVDSFKIGQYEVSGDSICRVLNWGLKNKKIQVEQRSGPGPVVISGYSDMPEIKAFMFNVESCGDDKKVKVGAFHNANAYDHVSWYGAVLYCNLRSEMEGLTPCYTAEKKNWVCDFNADGYRLPTEAEWEYAARGGPLSRDALFSGSDDIDQVATYNDESSTEYLSQGYAMVNHPRGIKAPNELGLFDMSGGTMEWCFDEFEEYEDSPQVNPGCQQKSKRTKGAARVIRGGNGLSTPEQCRVTARSSDKPERGFSVGLRVVQSVLPRSDSK